MFKQLQIIIADQLKIDKQLISINSSLKELKIDSLDFFQIALKIEDKFNIEITGYELEHVKIINDIVCLIKI